MLTIRNIVYPNIFFISLKSVKWKQRIVSNGNYILFLYLRCKPGKPGHPGFQDPRFHSSEFPGEQSTWTAGGEGGEDDESDSGNSRRKILKWECDEELGPNATISAILYCNMNHPELRSQHPEWNDRVKRIAKLWRSLSSDEKQPYLVRPIKVDFSLMMKI